MKELTPRQTRFRFSLAYFVYDFTVAVSSFIVAFLQEQGVRTAHIGWIMSMASVMGMLAPPLIGMLSDKIRSVKKVLIICLLLCGLLHAITPAASHLSHGSVILLGALVAFITLSRPNAGLMDSWIVSTASRTPGMTYGTTRLWASLGYAIASLGLTWMVAKLSLASTFYFYAIAAVATVFIFKVLPDDQSEIASKRSLSWKELDIGRLLKNYWIWTFLIFLTLRGVAMHCSGTFLSYLVQDVGADVSLIGTINFLRALCEVPLLIFSNRLIKRFGQLRLLIFTGIVYMLGELGYSMITSIGQLIAIQCCCGVCYGIFVASYVQYTAVIAPEGLRNTTQTLAVALPSISGIIGNALGGWIIEAVGLRTFYLLSASALAASVLFLLVSVPIGTRLLKQKLPEGVMGSVKNTCG